MGGTWPCLSRTQFLGVKCFWEPDRLPSLTASISFPQVSPVLYLQAGKQISGQSSGTIICIQVFKHFDLISIAWKIKRFYKQTQTLISDLFPQIESPTTLGHEMTMTDYRLCLQTVHGLSSSLASPSPIASQHWGWLFSGLLITLALFLILQWRGKWNISCTSMCIVSKHSFVF